MYLKRINLPISFRNASRETTVSLSYILDNVLFKVSKPSHFTAILKGGTIRLEVHILIIGNLCVKMYLTNRFYKSKLPRATTEKTKRLVDRQEHSRRPLMPSKNLLQTSREQCLGKAKSRASDNQLHVITAGRPASPLSITMKHVGLINGRSLLLCAGHVPNIHVARLGPNVDSL